MRHGRAGRLRSSGSAASLSPSWLLQAPEAQKPEACPGSEYSDDFTLNFALFRFLRCAIHTPHARIAIHCHDRVSITWAAVESAVGVNASPESGAM